jgi:hypothetical protein
VSHCFERCPARRVAAGIGTIDSDNHSTLGHSETIPSRVGSEGQTLLRSLPSRPTDGIFPTGGEPAVLELRPLGDGYLAAARLQLPAR